MDANKAMKTAVQTARGLSYTTSKFTIIKDWRIAVLHIGLSLAIVIGLIFQLIGNKSFLLTEVPLGTVTSWSSASDTAKYTGQKTFSAIQNEWTTADRCSDLNAYKFEYDADFNYDSPICSYMSPDELVKKKFDGGLHLATHIHYRKTLRVPDATATTAADCAATAPNSFNNASQTAGDAVTTFGNGICKYSSAQNLLPLGIEGMNFNIIPGYDTTSKNYAGVKPKTYVRRKGEDADVYTFEAGSNIALDVAQLMDLAGLDLDKTWDQQPNGFKPSDSEKGYGTSASAYPTVRLTGSRIMIDIKYYNYELDDVTSTEMGTDDVYAIVEVSGKVQWESRGQSITYRTQHDKWNSPFNKDGQPNGAFEDFYVYGINIDVTSSGIVAKFDIMLFINTVIAALVLLGTAKSICDVVATKLLGVKSQLFTKFMREEVDLERECARFAVQALVATHFFKQKDIDGSGNLDLEEIQQMLHGAFSKEAFAVATEGLDPEDKKYKKLMKSVLDDDEISALALYLMRCVDPERAKHKLEGTELQIEDIAGKSVNLNDFISIFTEDNMDISTMRTIITQTSLDDQVAAAGTGYKPEEKKESKFFANPFV
mmetsp:Transcript_12228/g.56657  ORF Transcript_12228/g.56657 Transcript_12228/m.56657 type:complete len:598 (-) Transcript_12228:1098-2891(-)